MKYKGYYGKVAYDDEAHIFHGEVLGLKDVITFQGETVTELQKAFKESVEDYLAWCKERGEAPEKAFSGQFRLRLPLELHAQLALAAAEQGLSLNSYIVSRLKH